MQTSTHNTFFTSFTNKPNHIRMRLFRIGSMTTDACRTVYDEIVLAISGEHE